VTRAGALFVVLCLLMLCDLSSGAGPVGAQCVTAQEFDANKIIWKSLTFKAESFFGTVKNDIQIKIMPVSKSEQFFITSPTGQVLNVAGPDLFSISVLSVIEPIIGASEYINSQAWYDPKPATVMQRTRLRQGKEKWQKTYRFTNKGVFRLRKKPDNMDETRMSPERWTNREGSYYPYGVQNDGCLRVLEPSILLYLASFIDPGGKEAPLSLCVFNKKQLHQVFIHKAGVNRLKVNYIARSGEREVHRMEEIETLKLVSKSRSLVAPNEEAEPFSFLGLKGDFDIYIDKASRIPVQVSGRVPIVGRTDFQLREIRLID